MLEERCLIVPCETKWYRAGMLGQGMELHPIDNRGPWKSIAFRDRI
jgi:hypothetical protein